MNKKIKNKLISYIAFALIISLFSIIYSLLIYYGKLSSSGKSFNIWTFLIGIVSFYFLGLFSGNCAQKNGLIEGLTAALIIILLSLLANLIIKQPLVTRSFVKTASFLVSASLGGIMGVNFKPVLIKNIE